VRFTVGRESVADSATPRDRAIALEASWHAHGPIALEDPRDGRMRLLSDHGIFFEFVPAEQVGKLRPQRYSLSEIEPGAIYALALTGAGAWACLTDVSVAFERRNPPLLTVVPASRRPLRIQPPHRQIAGIPAVPREILARSL
jgi:hypothetical protein